MLKKFAVGALMCLSTALCAAHDYTVGDVTIEHPWARATPPKAVNAGGFMLLNSKGGDQLIAASSDVAEKTEVHEMKMVDGVMKMRPLTAGLVLTPNQTVKLAPGGYHIMFIGIKQPFKEGDQFPLTLTFAKAGKVTVDVKVQAMTEMAAPQHGHE
ncbi:MULTISPECIES: copper chaperone PCu(A)C [Deefgea]|uniref:Copper chaperone PCu(A)C n=1 Tax=Deefgea chitinilytica TaxID=570276 RepID=A0ABS2CAW4_9NEIS|nr:MULTISPECIES: copper chaperone PCu(A)C [Deefgea]MBM5571293.1 copper chaperone PCu(A)C [Deefgea chitinilytica]MBM9888525.1 copper chaperone PCu(A)C [Deefgea sp. CFH1-16]